MPKNVILLSGGLDSATLLAHALAAGDTILEALTFDYGQRAAAEEIKAAVKLSGHYAVKHKIKRISFTEFGDNALSGDLPLPENPDPGDAEARREITVPGRNLLFIAYAVCSATRLGASCILYAAHDSWGTVVPDCRLPFVDPLDTATRFAYGVSIRIPFITKSKSWIARRAKELNVPTGLTWSCYAGGVGPCGRCRACVERREAEESV
jgi:7-cyano-7-deazaguanine synthase